MSARRCRYIVFVLSALVLFAGCTDPAVRKQKHYEKGMAFRQSGEMTKAIIELRNAVQIDPQFVDARFYLGRSLLDQGSFAAASSELKKVEDLEPKTDGIERYLAESLVGAGEFEEGRTLCEKVLAKEPNNADIYDILARALIGLNDTQQTKSGGADEKSSGNLIDEAISNAEHALELDPTLVEPHITMARAVIEKNRKAGFPRMNQQDETTVRSHLETAIKNSSDDVALLRRVAALWFWAGNRQQAFEYIAKALDIAPDDNSTLVLKAELLFNDGKVKESESIVKSLTESKLKSPRLDFLMGRILLNKGEFEQARQEFERVKTRVDAVYFLGVCFEQLGQKERAIQQFQSVLDVNPEHETARRALCRMYLSTGNRTRASLQADELIRIAPTSPAGYLVRAQIAIEEQDWPTAQQAINDALERDAASTEAALMQVQIYSKQGERQKAMASVNKLLDEKPDSAIVRQVRAEMYLSAGQYDAAEADALQAAAFAPGNPQPYVTVARARLGQQNIEGAETAYGQALELAPSDVSIRMAYARVLAGNKKYDQAIQVLIAVPQDSRLYVQSRRRIAELYDAKGDPESAVATFKNLTATHPDASDATVGLFQHYRQTSDYVEAEQLAKETVQKDPTDPLGHIMLSDLYASRGLWTRAADEMKAATKLRQDSPRLEFRFAALNVNAGRYEEALSAFQKARRLQPDFTAATLGSAKLMARMGRSDEGAALCEGVLKSNPDDPNAQLAMADIRVAQGNQTAAETLYKKIIQSYPRFLLPYVRMSAMYERDKNTADAKRILEDAVAANPDAAEPYVVLGGFYERQGDKANALGQYAKALDILPANPSVMDKLARLSSETGDYKTAEKQLRARIQQEPRDPRPRLNLALVLEKQGKVEEATKSLVDFIVDSDNPESSGMQLSQMFASMGRFDDIERLAQNLIKSDSTNWVAHY
ncbi:MAG: tetratricopeptide repeat protein, partial [Candidatus Hydrogenedentes bacterium]|nr:tetratricopeptide repeat protein [Candidatus Hydrogenedentota bacterium]